MITRFDLVLCFHFPLLTWQQPGSDCFWDIVFLLFLNTIWLHYIQPILTYLLTCFTIFIRIIIITLHFHCTLPLLLYWPFSFFFPKPGLRDKSCIGVPITFLNHQMLLSMFSVSEYRGAVPAETFSLLMGIFSLLKSSIIVMIHTGTLII